MPQSSITSQLSSDDILGALTTLGEDPTASRVDAIRAAIDAAPLLEGDRLEVIREAVSRARVQVDSARQLADLPLQAPAQAAGQIPETQPVEGFALAAARFGTLHLRSFHPTQAEAEIAMNASTSSGDFSVMPAEVRFATNGNIRYWRSQGEAVAQRKFPEPRLFEGVWEHNFGPWYTSPHCRVVVDLATDRLLAAQISNDRSWVDLASVEKDELAELLFKESGVSQSPKKWGLSPIALLPQWASPGGTRMSVGDPESHEKALRINVRQLVDELDPDDEAVAGVYAVTFNFDDAAMTPQRRASIALDIFHAHQGIECLDDFEIHVIDSSGGPVAQDEAHEDGSCADYGDVEKVGDALVAFGEGTERATDRAVAVGARWTDWFENPFKAIKAAAEARGTPQDYGLALDVLRESAEWDIFTSANFLDDVLQEIAGKTNIVCQYDDERRFQSTATYRAAYDEEPNMLPAASPALDM
jgi:hypothetical protein